MEERGKYFGTDGFRGKANEVLTATHAFRVGRVLGWYYGRNREKQVRIVIGKDTRRSCYMLEYAIAAGITASGGDGYILHVISTPGVSYICRTDAFDCGVMISASHNRFDDNGIKLFNSRGEKMEDDVIALVERYLDDMLPGEVCGGDLPLATGKNIGKMIDYAAGRNRYIAYLLTLSTFSYKGLKIGLDCANGSLWMIARSVFEALGAQTVAMGVSPDGMNINKDCGSTHIDGLRDMVLSEGLDIGFAFDGDGDRCLCVDEMGNVLTGDQILYLLGTHMKEKGTLKNDTVVMTVMSNTGAENALGAAGIHTVRTPVGDKYVYACMAREDYVLGGEDCGHIVCGLFANTGDGMVTAIQIMETVLDSKKTLGQLTAPVEMMAQRIVNLTVRDRQAAVDNPALKVYLEEAGNALAAGGGRILVRISGTEPVLRVMVEHPDSRVCKIYTDQVRALLEQEQLL